MSEENSQGIRPLFSPLTLRGVTFPNRIGVSPMCMYSATDGHTTDFHLVQLGRFVLGGAGLVIMEATAIAPEGRISHYDAGIWDDSHVTGLKKITNFITIHGSIPGIQLAHAGRRASVTEPWRGGKPLSFSNDRREAEPAWETDGPSALPAGPDWPTPHEMSVDDIQHSIREWADAARRAVSAGFQVIELHGAHGYLLHSFFSPLSNHRTDSYGGSAEGRMLYPLEVAKAVRAAISPDIVLSYRVSSVDGIDGGITIEDTTELAKHLSDVGVDIVDTSSGGITTDRSVDTRVRRGFGFHAEFSRKVKEETNIPTATVGMVVEPEQADALISSGACDIVLVGRGMLDDPNWAMHARDRLESPDPVADVRFDTYLPAWRKSITKLLDSGESPV